MMPPRPTLALASVLLMAACASFPQVDAATRAASGPAPKLIPVDGILAQADALGSGQAAVGTIEARAAGLRARAARLRRM